MNDPHRLDRWLTLAMLLCGGMVWLFGAGLVLSDTEAFGAVVLFWIGRHLAKQGVASLRALPPLPKCEPSPPPPEPR